MKVPQYKDLDCEEVPGFIEADDRRDQAIDDLVEMPAASSKGLVAKAQAVVHKRLQEGSEERLRTLATSLANDLLTYFGAVA